METDTGDVPIRSVRALDLPYLKHT
jgi:hypothetical protein